MPDNPPGMIRLDKFVIAKYGAFTDEGIRLVTWANRENWNGDTFIPPDYISPDPASLVWNYAVPRTDVAAIAAQFGTNDITSRPPSFIGS